MGSRRTGFSSCGARAYLLCGMWDLPGPGLEPVSPALAGGFLTNCATREAPRNASDAWVQAFVEIQVALQQWGTK